MKTTATKVYSTSNTRYSTIGRKNIKIESRCLCSELMPPKYGAAKLSHESKQQVSRMFN